MTEKDVNQLYSMARRAALEIVEQKARALLRKHPQLKEFVMAMGTWTFSYKAGGIAYNVGYIENSSLERFLQTWDDYLRLSGEPMRFTADGPVITEW